MYFADEARSLGVLGWVRNRLDGSVEATIRGTPDAVDKVVEWARRGPPSARVTDLQVSEADGSFERFDVRPSE
jgi:acylphosphatase